MRLKVALQMDPIGSVNINADSTFRIALEAQTRGHSLFFYTPDKLAFVEGRVMARGFPVEVRREVGFGRRTEGFNCHLHHLPRHAGIRLTECRFDSTDAREG